MNKIQSHWPILWPAILSLAISPSLWARESEAPRLDVEDPAERFYHCTIEGFSMQPTFRDQEQVKVDKRFPYEDLEVGDIVVKVNDRNMRIVHRIVEHYRGGFWITKGDGNDRKDQELLSPDNYRGRVVLDSQSRDEDLRRRLEAHAREHSVLEQRDLPTAQGY